MRMIGEACVSCAQKEGELELLHKKYYEEVQCMKSQIEKLKSENEALSLDVAFYNGNITNLSCNGK
jgi:cell division protein FtsB